MWRLITLNWYYVLFFIIIRAYIFLHIHYEKQEIEFFKTIFSPSLSSSFSYTFSSYPLTSTGRFVNWFASQFISWFVRWFIGTQIWQLLFGSASRSDRFFRLMFVSVRRSSRCWSYGELNQISVSLRFLLKFAIVRESR